MHSVVLSSGCSSCGLSGRPFQAVTLGDSPMREYVTTHVLLCSRQVQGLLADKSTLVMITPTGICMFIERCAFIVYRHTC